MAIRIEQQLSAPLTELAQQQRHELLEYMLDSSRAHDHARRLALAQRLPDLHALFATLASPDELRAALKCIVITPVLTSHPSEMRPPPVLQALASCDDAESACARLHTVPERVNIERPTISDEVTALTDHFTRVIFDAVPNFYETIEAAATRRFGSKAPSVPSFLRYHSWVGCDRDGNPECTASATLAAAAHMHRCIIERYQADLTEIAAMTEGTIAQRCFRLCEALHIVDDVTQATQEHFLHELTRLHNLSAQTPLARSFKRLLRRYETFGFHLATLEWRQHSEYILLAFDEREHALHPQHVRMAELDTQRYLSRIRESFSDEVELHDYEHGLTTPKAVELMHSLQALSEIRSRYGADAVGELIISNCEDVPVILALERLARDVDLYACGEMQVVPLFESLAALQHGPDIVRLVLAEPTIREKMTRLQDRFEIMVGYSDAAKDGGRIAADILICTAQKALIAACEPYGISPLVFHGRGGSFGRGYALFEEVFALIDPALPAGEIKITEQGEVVANRYGHARLAASTLQWWFHEAFSSVKRHARAEKISMAASYAELEQRIARTGSQVFQALRTSSSFMDSVRTLTELDIIRGFPLSSRPASREPGRQSQIDLASLRAVPFNIAFNLAFAQVPAWYGTGTALTEELKCSGVSTLRLAYERSPLLHASIERTRASLEVTNLDLLRRRAQSRGKDDFVTDLLDEETRARRAIAVITGKKVTISPRLLEQTSLDALAVFLETRQDEIDLYACYLALATIAASIGMTG